MRRLETYDWWPELVELKDELSLRELAERFSVTPGAISTALKRTGKTRKSAPPGPKHRPGEARSGSKDNLLSPFKERLGTVPDGWIAKEAGVSIRTVSSFRTRNEIGAYRGPRGLPSLHGAWQIQLNGSGSIVVVASSAKEALELIEDGSQVTLVQFVGPLL